MRNSIPFPSRPDGRPLCVAHRGASAHAVENTLQAFSTAAALGADMWEIDVYLTRDGHPVVSHDIDLTRIFGVEGRIANLTLAEIRARAPDLPTLDEVIALARALDQSLYVEIKARGAGRVAVERLQHHDFRRAGIGSFDIEEVRDLIATGCPYGTAILVRLGADPFEDARRSGADIIHLCWERGGDHPQDLVTPTLIGEAQTRGLGIVLWHEERKSVINDLIALPILGICTNQPELMAGCDSLDMHGIEIVCHRGANHFAPENTLAAARLSLDQGCHYIEVDVRESADGELVLIHDPTLERTTDGAGRVVDHTLADLRRLDAGSWFSPFYRGESIPTLREMVDLCQSYGRQIYIENKSADPEKIIALVTELDFAERCFHWSGNDRLQSRLREISPSARVKSSRSRYSSLEDLRRHLDPEIVEILYEDYADEAHDIARMGITPMLQYFGDDPTIFDKIVALQPPLVNLDRADLLLAALRRVAAAE